MQPEDITPKLLEVTLRTLRQGEICPGEMLSLNLLSNFNSPTEKSTHLFELLIKLGMDSLKMHRQIAGISISLNPTGSKEGQIEQLSLDFSKGDPELEAWSAVYYRYLASNSLRVSELSEAAHVAPRQFRRRVERGITYLVTALRHTESDLPKNSQNPQLSRHLPPPDYIQLFGINEIRNNLFNLLTTPAGPKFISLEGLGGIGKTALAQAVAWQMAEKENLAGISWISARHEWLNSEGFLQKISDPVQSCDDIIARLTAQIGQEQLAGLPTAAKLEQLQPFLSREPFLIIIDNLETMSDIQSLLPALYPLAGATRFLLTSRTSLRRFPFVQIFPMEELSIEDSQALLENELHRRGRTQHIPMPSMQELYETIGGHPLALKLASAQMGNIPMRLILERLKEAHQLGPELMYSYIYRQTWSLLDEPAKKLLLSMLMVSPDGESLDWIQLMSALPSQQFDQALAQLRNYSLLEIGGKLDNPYYRLHRLTVTFLQTDILSAWQSTTSD